MKAVTRVIDPRIGKSSRRERFDVAGGARYRRELSICPAEASCQIGRRLGP